MLLVKTYSLVRIGEKKNIQEFMDLDKARKWE